MNQDIPHGEYEIICVNDCSPDNLSDVVRSYQQRYSNVILIEHTENKTAGGARNTGVNIFLYILLCKRASNEQ